MNMLNMIGRRIISIIQAGLGVGAFLLATSSLGENLNEPIFRISGEEHTSDIARLATDARGKWLATVSSDKAVMIWRMPSGQREAVLRIPIGPGEEGVLESVAMSPDGSLVAVSGITGPAWSQGYAVYVLDRASGRMVHRLPGLSTPASDLRWSLDGKLLAVGLKAPSSSVVLYRTNTWASVGTDTDYDGSVGSVEFLSGDRMLTASTDGLLRLYQVSDKVLTRIQETTVPGGAELSLARVHPNGEKIAVNFCSSNKVTVIDARTLKLLYAVNTGPISEGFTLNREVSCDRLAWSPDGRYLYRGGNERRSKYYAVDVWDQEGHGEKKSISVARETISDLLTTPGNGVIWSANNGVWGVLRDDAMAIMRERKTINFKVARHYGVAATAGSFSMMPDYDNEVVSNEKGIETRSFPTLNRESNLGKSIQLSEQGNVISFVTGADSLQRVYFDVLQQSYVEGNSGLTRLNPFDAHWVSAGKGREGGLSIAGQAIKLPNGDSPVSLVLAPDRNTVYVGSQHAIFKYKSSGRLEWQAPSSGAVLDMATSADGRFVAAAMNDGTLRWYLAAEGRELVAIFPLADMKRWVMWTPEGYYSATPGTEDLIGWHLNQGKDKEASFIPSGQLYDVFFRPDIVQAKFRGDDISSMITITAAQALKMPPPILSFTKVPSTTKSNMERVCYKAVATRGGIGEVRLFQNGKLIKSDGFYRETVAKDRGADANIKLAAIDSAAVSRALKLTKTAQKAEPPMVSNSKGNEYSECQEVETIPGDNEISVAAFNANNTIQSSLETTHFTADRKAEAPRLYVLGIGIDKYTASENNLSYAVKDATDFRGMIQAKAKGLFDAANIHIEGLNDAQATKAGIQQAIAAISARVKPWDSFILFVASHGYLQGNQYYIVTADFDGMIDTDKMISSNEIVGMSKNIKSLSQLLIFDTCHAGGVDNIIGGLYDARMSVMAKKMGLHIYASAGSTQTALDGYQGNGLFTHALLDSMSANSTDSNHDNEVSVAELGESAKQETMSISKQLGFPQSPTIINFGKDNALFRVK